MRQTAYSSRNKMLSNIFYLVNFSFSMFCSSLALIFAFLTISIVVGNRDSRTISNVLVCNTAIAVMSFHIINLISIIYALIDDPSRSLFFCIFLGYCYAVFSAAICYSYSIQALSQLFFTVLYQYRILLTWKIHSLMIFFVWLISFTTMCPPIFYQGYRFEIESRLCIPTSKVFITSIYVVAIVFVIPLNIIFISYGTILYGVHRSTRRISAFASNKFSKFRSRPFLNVKREMKLMKNMFILLLILISGGTPYLFIILWQIIQRSPVPESMYLLAINCVPICISINMIVLFFMSDSMRKLFFQFLNYAQHR